MKRTPLMRLLTDWRDERGIGPSQYDERSEAAAAVADLIHDSTRMLTYLEQQGLTCDGPCGNPHCRTKALRAALAHVQRDPA